MELRKFLSIYSRHRFLGIGIIVGSLIIGFIFFLFQEQTYETSLQLNVTRGYAKKSDAYEYDHFYRLQADERFADTVVQWIKSPSMNNQLFVQNGHLTAKRLSSQMVVVTYVTDSVKDAEVVAKKLVTALNETSYKLNAKQKSDNWFVVIGEDPVVAQNAYTWFFVMMVSFALGICAAFWGVLIYYYFSDPQE